MRSKRNHHHQPGYAPRSSFCRSMGCGNSEMVGNFMARLRRFSFGVEARRLEDDEHTTNDAQEVVVQMGR